MRLKVEVDGSYIERDVEDLRQIGTSLYNLAAICAEGFSDGLCKSFEDVIRFMSGDGIDLTPEELAKAEAMNCVYVIKGER